VDCPSDFIIPALNIRYVMRANPAGNMANGQVSHTIDGIPQRAGVLRDSGTHQIAQPTGVSSETTIATIASRHAVTAGKTPLNLITSSPN